MNSPKRRINPTNVKDLQAESPAGCREMRLSPVPSSVGLAREGVARHLRGLGLAHLVETAVLVVSELTTNAVREGAKVRPDLPITVRVILLEDGRLCIEVQDCSDELPRLQTADPYQENGRGLLLVEALSDQCGYRKPPTGGKVVYAVLS
jgi:anti-sigma regulatory factor (Ser/Thr protein kinase)